MKICFLFCLLCALSGCSKDADFIKGRPIEFTKIKIFDTAPTPLNAALLGPTRSPTAWSHPNGSAQHTLGHLELNPVSKLEAQSQEEEAFTVSQTHGISPVVMDGMVYTLSVNGTMRAYMPGRTKPSKKWSLGTLDSPPVGMTAFNGRLFVSLKHGALLAWSPEGKLLWKAQVNGLLSNASCAFDDKLVVLTMNNDVFCFQTTTGKLLWEYKGLGEISIAHGGSSPAFDGERILLGMTNGKIIALSAQNGDMVWAESGGTFDEFPHILACPVVDLVSKMIYTVSFNGKLSALDQHTGQMRWFLPIASQFTPALAGQALFVLGSDNTLFALNKAMGHVFWKVPLEKECWVGGPVVASGKVYLLSTQGRLYLFDALTGKKETSISFEKKCSSAPIIYQNKLYVHTQDGQLVLFS